MNPLMLYPYQIIIIFAIIIIMVVTAMVLASKKESNIRFIIWGIIILFVPFLGALAYIISYYSNEKKVKTT
ncbi:hypothetical protein H9I45_10750 [Polaribacter haliotis]|uniref:Cardiolipin synthase N-terminal domain-containing protein n=1 Tax=Polaribacter haliotis TaxID=1888915 RepID=A0A7L8ACV3_9FLAO|nr:hypothetical protein [Polaribacter haliotis]QOD59826.1 hypothetical protein H9I45_10750 [Polaribacter haliotis]